MKKHVIKFIATALSVLMLLSSTGCGFQEKNDNPSNMTDTTNSEILTEKNYHIRKS